MSSNTIREQSLSFSRVVLLGELGTFRPTCCKLAAPARWQRAGYNIFHVPQQQIGAPMADDRSDH